MNLTPAMKFLKSTFLLPRNLLHKPQNKVTTRLLGAYMSDHGNGDILTSLVKTVDSLVT